MGKCSKVSGASFPMEGFLSQSFCLHKYKEGNGTRFTCQIWRLCHCYHGTSEIKDAATLNERWCSRLFQMSMQRTAAGSWAPGSEEDTVPHMWLPPSIGTWGGATCTHRLSFLSSSLLKGCLPQLRHKRDLRGIWTHILSSNDILPFFALF